MMDEVPLHKDSKLFRPYSGIKSTGIRSFFDSVFVKKEEGLYNENIIYEWGSYETTKHNRETGHWEDGTDS